MGYTVTRALQRSYEDTVKAVREALAEQGFGVLTEIDLAGTLKQKLDVDIPPQVILGACRPPLVEILDPETMVTLTGEEELRPVADEARQRLLAALDSLS